MIKRFYFAHPVTMYGTNGEKQVIDAFKKNFHDTDVENPNQPCHSEGYKREGMDYFVKLCDKQDGAFFTCFSDGSIGRGVATEVTSFIKRGAPAFFFSPVAGVFEMISSLEQMGRFTIRSVDETRAMLNEERSLKSAGKDPYADLKEFGDAVKSHQLRNH